MRTMARTEPTSKVTSFTNWYTTQMGAYSQHDKPFRVLDARTVWLWITECFPFGIFGFLDLVSGTVADEYRLATPFDDDLASLSQRCVEDELR